MIGLTGRRKLASQIVAMAPTLAERQLDLYYCDYTRAVISAGGLPIHLPLDVDPSELIDRLDGVILSGGADIGPHHYGAASETDTFPPEPERDEFELELMKSAVHSELPVLGICRGHQVINVQCGGSLNQDVPPHAAFDRPPETELHEVTFKPGSLLAQMYGPSMRANSLHHQTIREVAPGLQATAHTDDGVIEGLEHGNLPIVSVQWHPEMMVSRDSDPIFGWLVNTAATRSRP